MRIKCTAIMLLLIASIAGAEDKRWISSEGTALKAEAVATSKNVADVLVGTEVSLSIPPAAG